MVASQLLPHFWLPSCCHTAGCPAAVPVSWWERMSAPDHILNHVAKYDLVRSEQLAVLPYRQYEASMLPVCPYLAGM
jgi:hypothetical protein